VAPKLFKRTTIWWPTLLGWVSLTLIGASSCLSWVFVGEPFLSRTHRLPAEILVVEGWIGPTGVKAALAEFSKHGYQAIIVTSGMTGARWDEERWSYAVEAAKIARRAGVAESKIILAVPRETEVQRTFESALAVREAIKRSGSKVTAVNVFTRGSHAKRSRLVFEKVLRPDYEVGAVSWSPPGYETEPWWSSSDRMVDLLKESVAYCLEFFLDSGRRTNAASPTAPIPKGKTD
jgi:uncharacterized SAM-binding protein YcdF (DUF218 family)